MGPSDTQMVMPEDLTRLKVIQQLSGCLNLSLVFTCSAGASSSYYEHVSDTINKRLGDGWQDGLQPPYKATGIFFLPGDNIGPLLPSDRCKDLSINWCRGDSCIEIVDGTLGNIIDW